MRFKNRQKGSALLAVLWLSAALSAIAFSLALTVRGETSRVSAHEEDVRAYYLAQGAIQQAILHMEWSRTGRQNPEAPYFVTGQPQLRLAFPSGDATVEVIPEAGKLSLNLARPERLEALLLNLGVNPDQAPTIAAAIVDWRTPHNRAEPTAFDQLYLQQQPSFQAAHASFQDVEELLYLQGMTPDLFYGTWVRQADDRGSRLVRHTGLRDCVSVFGSTERFDVNTVEPAVLAAMGHSTDEIAAVVERRQAQPFLTQQELSDFAQSDAPLLSHLGIAPHSIYTLRATARMRRPDGSLSDLKRTVSATVKFLPAGGDRTFQFLRWYDRG